MPASDTRIGVCLTLLALSTAACSDRGGPEDFGRTVEASGQDAAGWVLVQTGDFNFDGMQDVLWNERGTNHQVVWSIHGTALLEKGSEIPGPSGSGWVVATAGDFNLDGMADVHWYNSALNRMTVWLMHGTGLLEKGPEIPGPSGAGWTAVTTGDFNLDGMADVIWHNSTTKRMAVWLMGGTTLLEAGPEIPGPPGNEWKVAYAGDTDADGMADAIWLNSTLNAMAVWTMNGTQVVTRGPWIPGPL